MKSDQDTADLPLIYACSGCSSVAQLANDIALDLDHRHKAEMSCISGVGGGVNALVRQARSGRRIIAIDGCALHCTQACLRQVEVEPDTHIRLYEMGHKKRRGVKASKTEFRSALKEVEQQL